VKQLSFLEEIEPAPAPAPAPATRKLTRDRLARLDYEMICPLSFIGQTSYCHNCTLFAGGEIERTGSAIEVTMTCRGAKYTGPGYGFKPGNARRGWRSIVAWVEAVFEVGNEGSTLS
jgi:hypothetical protein